MEALGGFQNQQNGHFSRRNVDFPVLELSWWRLGLEGSKTSKRGVSAVKMLIFRFWNSAAGGLAWRVPKPAKRAFQPSKS